MNFDNLFRNALEHLVRPSWLLAFSVPLLIACSGGGGSEDRNLLAAIGVDGPNGFMVWEGNDNGEFVVDVNGDAIRFMNQTGILVYGSTSNPNSFVDFDGTVIAYGNVIGALWYVESLTGGRVVGLIGTNGNWLDIFGLESALAWQQTLIAPFPNLLPLRIAPVYLEPDVEEIDYGVVAGPLTPASPDLMELVHHF